MDTGINLTTKEIVNAWTLEVNPSYQFIKEEIWYADPNNIESYDKEKVKDITKIEVKYRKGNASIMNKFGTEYSIAPCFYIPNKTELGINLIPESKQHKLAKNWIYNKLKSKSLKFRYSSVKRPFQYDNIIELKDLDVDYKKIGIEVSVKNNKVQRADIILAFNKFHELLGNGIVIEIQFSKQYDSTTKERNFNWAFKGYSICWIWQDDFESLSDDFIEMKDDTLLLEPMYKILHELKEKGEYDIRVMIQELSRQIVIRMKEINYPFVIGNCNVCGKGYMTKKVSKKDGNKFYSCSNWKLGCGHSISIPRGEGDGTD